MSTVTRAELDKRPADVAGMFDDLARRYDLTNDVLSMGQDRRWRKSVLAAVGARPGDRVLDLAAGTGTSSQPFLDAGVQVVPCDFSQGMLGVGKRSRPGLDFTAGDATMLPFADGSFDAVAISFGLRNIVEARRGLVEMLRVTRPGGRLVVCEFSHPTWAPFRTVYVEYLMRALPRVARTVSSEPGGLRLSRRVDSGVARSAWPRRLGPGGGVDRRRLAQPLRRHRHLASRDPPGRTARRLTPHGVGGEWWVEGYAGVQGGVAVCSGQRLDWPSNGARDCFHELASRVAYPARS